MDHPIVSSITNGTSRSDVYRLIDGERNYQDSISDRMNHKGHPTIEAELLMMEHYLADARTKWVTSHGDNFPPLDSLRKVAGIAVRCMENHVTPMRR